MEQSHTHSHLSPTISATPTSMRVAVVGAGAVGKSIAIDLIAKGHGVVMIDKNITTKDRHDVPRCEWFQADACEFTRLEQVELQNCDVVVCATGDDKVNLVVSLLAKTEFAVKRVVSRVNEPSNEWLFDESWGVDVAVSTPRILVSLIEEAVNVGELVPLMVLRQSGSSLMEFTLASDTELAGTVSTSLSLPTDCALVSILRGSRVLVPGPEHVLEAGDELLFVASNDQERNLRALLLG